MYSRSRKERNCFSVFFLASCMLVCGGKILTFRVSYRSSDVNPHFEEFKNPIFQTTNHGPHGEDVINAVAK